METFIASMVDKYLQKAANSGLHQLPRKIPAEMCDPAQDQAEEWKRWFAIPGTTKEAELLELENELGYRLPESFKFFIRYKHFCELQIAEVSFFANEIHTWRSNWKDMIFNGYPRELIFDKGYIPFANYSDWGLLCFDTTKPANNNDLSITLWDHERLNEHKFMYPDFEQLMLELDLQEKSGTR
jgi:hypothetical protein